MRSLLLSILCFVSCPAHSAVISAERISVSGARLDGIRWQIDRNAHQIDIERLRYEDLALDGRSIKVVCGVTEGPRCSGTVKGKSWPRFELSAQWPEQTVSLTWPDGELRLGLPEAGLAIHAVGVPLAWLKPRANQSWAGLAALEGQLDLELLIAEPDWQGEWKARALSFDQDDGQIAGAGIDAGGTILYQVPSGTFGVDATLARGELLVGPLYRQIGPPAEYCRDRGSFRASADSGSIGD
ncbi:MAG: hypothetical protein IPK97_16100 [Ahniella sp.]|nr:hypothetical protein [Ahniella sp.]